MAIVFPRKLLMETDHDWNLSGIEMNAGRGTYSPSVSVRTDGGGFWTASLNNIRFPDTTYTLLWRALRQATSNGVVPFVVPRNDTSFAPLPNGAELGPLPHSDGAFFDDKTGYYQPAIDIEIATDAALRATTLVLAINSSAPLIGGEAFSIEHSTMGWRMYEIATVEVSGDIQPYAVVTFNPPLREAVTAGTYVEFDRPRCIMKLLDAKAMDLNVTTYPFSLVSVKFIESKFS